MLLLFVKVSSSTKKLLLRAWHTGTALHTAHVSNFLRERTHFCITYYFIHSHSLSHFHFLCSVYILFVIQFYFNEFCFVYFAFYFYFFCTQFCTATNVRNVREFATHWFIVFDVHLDGIFTMCNKSLHLFMLGRFQVSSAEYKTQLQIKFLFNLNLN